MRTIVLAGVLAVVGVAAACKPAAPHGPSPGKPDGEPIAKAVARAPVRQAAEAAGPLPANRIEGHGTEGACEGCHSVADPVPGNAALKPCPRKDARGHDPDQGPDVVRLAELRNQYQPVDFDHRHHARMAAMGNGCASCHHHEEEEGRIQPCKACHPAAAAGRTDDLNKPGLKGAYHRQCLGCHREWSHVNGCGFCHMKAAKPGAETPRDRTDIVGTPHPVVETRDTRVYKTSHADGPLVTFRHKEHVDRFGLRCVDCHRKEKCSRCHHTEEAGPAADAKRVHHEPCRGCHEKEIAGSCGTCHDKVEKPAFAHKWPLGRQHEGLSCRACHPTGKPIGRISGQCRACHKDMKHAWPLGRNHASVACDSCHPKGQPYGRIDKTCRNCHKGWKDHRTFDHKVTGQALDETHRDNAACADCHPGGRWDRPPACKGCHDDKAYPKDRPGPVAKGGR
ncbi:MAG: cytochrome c3 family protein [Deltaproteobacteria bacterium]|nr:cytochrome c3 family protein [Deltaproteobacteria bacterium]